MEKHFPKKSKRFIIFPPNNISPVDFHKATKHDKRKKKKL